MHELKGASLRRGHLYSNYFDNYPALSGTRIASDGHRYPVQ